MLNFSKNVNNNKKILILDGSNLIIRAKAIAQKYQLNLYGSFLKTISKLVDKFKPEKCYLVFDGQGNSQTKRKIFPQYKMNRGNVSKIQTQQFDILFKLLQFLPLITIRENNIQGDDVISHISLLQKENDIIICSADKDFYQLVSNKILIWSPIKKILIDEKYVIQNFKCHPKNFSIYKSLLGDSSDNIPGIPGLGPKTFVKHFGQLFSNILPIQGDLDNFKLYVQNMENSKIKNKILQNFNILYDFQKIISLNHGSILNPRIGLQITQSIKNYDANLDFKNFMIESNRHLIKKEDIQQVLYGMRLLQKYKM